MKGIYETPVAEQTLLGKASFLESSGGIGDAVAVDLFEPDFGSSF